MTENIESKTETIVSQPAIGGMMLRKRVREGKKRVYRMVYVDNPTPSRDPEHNARREAKRTAAQRAKEQKADIQKEIKKQMDIFDMRFILACMNKYAPSGYKFVTVGNDNRIAMHSDKIMGNQTPRGAFISDISFDLIFGLYGDLLNGKEAGPDDNLYERIKFFQYNKPAGISQEKHDKYMNIIQNIRAYDFGMLVPFATKRAPTRPMLNKNAILVQGVMDSGQMPPKDLNERMHKIANETVWWAFRRVMLGLRLSRLQNLRKTYRNHLASRAVVPGKKFGLTTAPKLVGQISQKQKEREQKLDKLIHHTLPQAIAEASDEVISLHRQMAQLVELQPSKFSYARFAAEDEIKPSKKLKHIIQRETEELCSGITQKQNIENTRESIRKTIAEINGAPKEIYKPARNLMKGIFYVNGDTDHLRKINEQTSRAQQLWWLLAGRISRTK